MGVHTVTFQLHTSGFCDIHDITPQVERALRESAQRAGTATAFVPGSTAAITTIEYESGALEDFRKAIERIVPQDAHYDHDARWGDGNGFAHVRAALLGPSLAVPFAEGKLMLGTWQQIIFIDFDNRRRQRTVVVQITGE